MNNSLILTVIDLIGKRKTENLIEKGFFNKSTELNEKEILECIERYKEIDSAFKVPSLDKIKATMENSEQVLLKSGELGIKCTSIFNDNFPDKLKNIKVLIVGCGGVGGYALETLLRSGIENIDLIDFDKIDITNLNRQIITNNENINLYKVDEAKKRALSINPKININTFKLFLDKDNIDEILNNNYDYIIDLYFHY